MWHRKDDWGLGVGRTPFLSCPVSNCYATEDPWYADKVSNFDAVLFSLENMVCPFADHRYLRKFRWQHMRYVAFTLKTPQTSVFDFGQDVFKGFFNWTMTYRKDSDIAVPWGRVVKNSR